MLVSVVIPCFNAERYIRDCLDSLLAQEYQNFEIVCVDDCSTDATLSIVKEYAQKDKRIRHYSLPVNSGSAKIPRDKAVSFSEGKWICNIDADDKVDPHYLQALVERQRETGADVVTTRMVGFNEEGKELFSVPSADSDFNKVMSGREAVNLTIGGWKISMSGALVLKAIWQNQARYLDCSLCHMNADEFGSREILTMAKAVALCDVVYHYRMNYSGISLNPKREAESLLTHYENVMLFEKKYGCYSAERRKAATVCISGIMDRIRSEKKDEVRHLIRKCYHQLTWGMIWTSHVSVKRKLLFSLPYSLTEKIVCFNRKTFDAR